jgi:hypothetical protein
MFLNIFHSQMNIHCFNKMASLYKEESNFVFSSVKCILSYRATHLCVCVCVHVCVRACVSLGTFHFLFCFEVGSFEALNVTIHARLAGP